MVKKRRLKPQDIDILNISNFILIICFIFQESISNNRTSKTTQSINNLREISKNLQKEFINQWNSFLKYQDQEKIFSLGLEILKNLPESPETEKLLSDLKKLATQIISHEEIFKYDYIGRVYNKLLHNITGGLFSAYFTQIPASILLSNLLIKSENENWDFQKKESIKGFKIIDPACGSGTLITSIYSAIKDFILEINSEFDVNWLHKILLEEVLWGGDVIEFATYLTRINLSLFNSNSFINKFHVDCLPNGIDEGDKIHLGALEYIIEPFSDKFDIVIMNPPFSRSAKPNIKFGYESKEIKRRMRKKLSDITKKTGYSGIGKAGLGAYFIVLADKLIKMGGRIGVVIPRAILSGVSWKKIREMLWNKYEIEYIISNYDPGNRVEKVEGWNWSENTDLGEVIIISRKTKKLISDRKITYINIFNKPRDAEYSLDLVKKILQTRDKLKNTLLEHNWEFISKDNQNIAVIYNLKQGLIKNNWLIPCLFSHPDLNKFLIEIQKIPSNPLKDLISKGGRDIKQIKTNFKQSKSEKNYPMIFGHQSAMNKMYLDKSYIKFGTPRKKKSETFHKENKSNILIGTRPHITNDCILAAESQVSVLATAFWEIKLKDEKLMPLVLLWLNSTFGFLTVLGYSTSSKAQTFRLKKGQLVDIPIPKHISIKKSKNLYQSIKNKEFLRFQAEFTRAYHNKGLRKRIDDFFLDELELKMDLKPIYGHLIEEPSLTLKKR